MRRISASLRSYPGHRRKAAARCVDAGCRISIIRTVSSASAIPARLPGTAVPEMREAALLTAKERGGRAAHVPNSMYIQSDTPDRAASPGGMPSLRCWNGRRRDGGETGLRRLCFGLVPIAAAPGGIISRQCQGTGIAHGDSAPRLPSGPGPAAWKTFASASFSNRAGAARQPRRSRASWRFRIRRAAS